MQTQTPKSEHDLIGLYGPALGERREGETSVAEFQAEIRDGMGKITNLATQMNGFKDSLAGIEAATEKRMAEALAGLVTEKQATEARAKAKEEYDTKLNAVLDNVDEFRTMMKRAGNVSEDAEPHAESRAAFHDFISLAANEGSAAGTSERLDAFQATTEYRDLAEKMGATGGFFLDPMKEAQIDKDITEISDVRARARVISGTAKSIEVMRRTGTPTAQNLGETGTATESSSTYGEIEIGAYSTDVETRATVDMLNDVPQIENEIINDAIEAIAELEGYNFVLGDGVKKPAGFMLDGDVVVGADTTTGLVTADSMIATRGALKTAYLRDAEWTMNRATLSNILALKDSNNNYLWNFTQGFAAGEPERIVGQTWFISPDMVNEGADTKPVAIASWGRAYLIYDRMGIRVLRNPYKTNKYVTFNIDKRSGGRIVRAEAMKTIQT